jgi:hypothetical protein
MQNPALSDSRSEQQKQEEKKGKYHQDIVKVTEMLATATPLAKQYLYDDYKSGGQGSFISQCVNSLELFGYPLFTSSSSVQ